MKTKLLWLLALVIAFDFGITILGQPVSYWHHPETAQEGNPVFNWFMTRGVGWYFALILFYTAGVVALVRRLPPKAGIITGSVFFLVHFTAGSGWLAFHFHHDMMGPTIYALILSVAFVSILNSSGWNLRCGEDVAPGKS